jgi:hypothetical protein
MFRPVVLVMAFFFAACAHSDGQEKKDESQKDLKSPLESSTVHSKLAPVGRNSFEVALLASFADAAYTYDDLLADAKDLLLIADDRNTKCLLTTYIGTLERMAKTKKEKENEKNEIKKIIYSLRFQRDFRIDVSDSTSPAGKLLAIGKKAVPFLIGELENDDFTRSVSPEISVNGKVVRPMYVLRVGDCVCDILNDITGQRFGGGEFIHGTHCKVSPKQVREEAKSWWDKQSSGQHR